MCNRYLVRLRHPVMYGIDMDLLADDTAEAATLALAECPADSFIERIIPMAIDVLEPDGSPTKASITSKERMVPMAETIDTPAPAPHAGSGVNRYRIELRHPDQDGTDVEVIAADEADALAQAEAGAPAGSTVLRIVPLEIDYVAPAPPPVSTDPTGTGMAARTLRASGVGSEPALHDDDAPAKHKEEHRARNTRDKDDDPPRRHK